MKDVEPTSMRALRRSITLARLILAWFVLTLGVAVASPMLSPKAMQLVCANGGVKAVLVDGSGDATPPGHHTLDCPMCLSAVVPAVPPVPKVAQPLPLAHTRVPLSVSRIAAMVGAALPPRGPPASL
jgi:hypothetical protein